LNGTIKEGSEIKMKKEKRFEKLKGAALGVILTLIIMTAVPAFARVAQETITVNFNNIRIAVDGRQVQTEYEPFIFQGRTYLPVRDVADAMGFDVTWDNATNTVHLRSRTNTNAVPNYPPHQSGQQQGSITIPDTITPRPPSRTGGPTNPTITARRAVELARDYLISIGVTSARFDYIYMDREGNTWVWSVEFDGQGRSFEFYVDVNTGAFLKAPQISPAPMPAVPPITTTPSPQISPSPGSGQGNRPSNPTISLQRAIEIAYADLAARGINATYHSNSGMSLERGQWVWELLFITQGERMPFIEYYINVDNGNIVKFEWDD